MHPEGPPGLVSVWDRIEEGRRHQRPEQIADVGARTTDPRLRRATPVALFISPQSRILCRRSFARWKCCLQSGLSVFRRIKSIYAKYYFARWPPLFVLIPGFHSCWLVQTRVVLKLAF
ncbi:unnamed protein product [Ixodes pacificus]